MTSESKLHDSLYALIGRKLTFYIYTVYIYIFSFCLTKEMVNRSDWKETPFWCGCMKPFVLSSGTDDFNSLFLFTYPSVIFILIIVFPFIWNYIFISIVIFIILYCYYKWYLYIYLLFHHFYLLIHSNEYWEYSYLKVPEESKVFPDCTAFYYNQ